VAFVRDSNIPFVDVSAKWVQNYIILRRLFEQNGVLVIPESMKQWAKFQRSYRRKGVRLSQKQIDLLDQIGFQWDV
jgi:hypothetical protein